MILIGVAVYFAVAALFVQSLVWAASRPMPKPDDVRNEKHEYDLPPASSANPAELPDFAAKLK